MGVDVDTALFISSVICYFIDLSSQADPSSKGPRMSVARWRGASHWTNTPLAVGNLDSHLLPILTPYEFSENNGVQRIPSPERHSFGFNPGSSSVSRLPDQYSHLPSTSAKKPSNKPPNKIIRYQEKYFGVWFHPSGRPREVRLLYEKNIIPNEEYCRHHDIEHRYVDIDGVKFVVYVENGKILGSQYTSRTHVQNGTEINVSQANKFLPRRKDRPTRSFIYNHKEVGVWTDYAGKPRSVGLLSTNIIPTVEDRMKYNLNTFVDHKDGVYFMVHELLPSKNILGIELVSGSKTS
ncbi:uncharacterized protein LOC117179577 [Belonocnema kinseyi]|uniref:uncharacterized protein LOC117179577 n=1 Tax=Belonocnema kinseyi TaxID=2817044 RepID=UPI00143DE398|nr:uncharacterized protein LOC117179577 [Belonocnema kinseyi]